MDKKNTAQMETQTATDDVLPSADKQSQDAGVPPAPPVATARDDADNPAPIITALAHASPEDLVPLTGIGEVLAQDLIDEARALQPIWQHFPSYPDALSQIEGLHEALHASIDDLRALQQETGQQGIAVPIAPPSNADANYMHLRTDFSAVAARILRSLHEYLASCGATTSQGAVATPQHALQWLLESAVALNEPATITHTPDSGA